MEYLSIFMWILVGIMFNKIFTSILNFGLLTVAFQKTTVQLLLCLIFVEEDIQYLTESKKLMLKEKGLSDEEIERLLSMHNKAFNTWRERVITTLIQNYPEDFREKMLPFNDWNGAAKYVNTIIKLTNQLANKK